MGRRTSVLAVSALAIIASGGLLVAGPLSPPAEPVASSYKTLSEVQPRIPIGAATTPGDADSVYRITAPGSYYLTGNIQGATGKSGIEIATDSVWIDLSGYTVFGTVGSLSGITGQNRTNVAVSHGAVRSWGVCGVDLQGALDSRVSDVTVEFNATDGLIVGVGARVDGVTARGNLTGLQTSSDAVITGCIAVANHYGIEVGAHSLVRDCEAADNTASGFLCSSTGPIFENCVAVSNDTQGFDMSGQARIERCVARFNTGHGISVGSESSVLFNMCDNNGVSGTGAGIYAAAGATRCRIEGNTCTSADWGIKLDGGPHLVIGNRCSINTVNFEIVAGNRVGTIVTLPTSAAISGSSGGNSAGADPACNLAY